MRKPICRYESVTTMWLPRGATEAVSEPYKILTGCRCMAASDAACKASQQALHTVPHAKLCWLHSAQSLGTPCTLCLVSSSQLSLCLPCLSFESVCMCSFLPSRQGPCMLLLDYLPALLLLLNQAAPAQLVAISYVMVSTSKHGLTPSH